MTFPPPLESRGLIFFSNEGERGDEIFFILIFIEACNKERLVFSPYNSTKADGKKKKIKKK